MSHLVSLTKYKKWANDLIFKSLKDVSEEDLYAPRPIVFGSLAHTINHTYCMDRVWQAHLQNMSHEFTTRNPMELPTLGRLSVMQSELDAWFVAYADSLSVSTENEIVEFEFIGGGFGAMSRRDILLHVVNHGTYHRGNITGIMYDCSVMPPTTDYPVFLREQSLNIMPS